MYCSKSDMHETKSKLVYAHLPLVGVSHDNVSALLVVLGDAHLGHIFRPFDPQSLINLILLQKTQNMSHINNTRINL